MTTEKICNRCLHWDRSKEIHRGRSVGLCMAEGRTSDGLDSTFYFYGCADFTKDRGTVPPCTKLAELEKRLEVIESKAGTIVYGASGVHL